MKEELKRSQTFKTLMVFSIPFFISYFLQTLYGMADLYITGQFAGTADVTAVSIGSQFMHLVTVVLVGLSMGTTVVVARFLGENKPSKAGNTIGTAAVVLLTCSVVLAGLFLLSSDSITRIMMTPEEAAAGTKTYLAICFAGIPFVMAYNLISAVYRGMGDSSTPMWFILIACLANIGLDYYLIGIMKMGPAGAALGTTLSQLISVVFSLAWMKTHPLGLEMKRSSIVPRKDLALMVLKTGVPVAMQDGLIQVAFLLITLIANSRGLSDAAAVGITEKVIGFLFLVPSSMLASISAIDARYIGAGEREKAIRTLRQAIYFCTAYGLLMFLLMQPAASWIISAFDDSRPVVKAGTGYLRAYSADCIFAGISFCLSGYFCAAEKSYLSFLSNILSIFLVRIPGSWLMSILHPETLIYMGLASPAGSLFSAILSAFLFWRIHPRQKS